MEKRQNLEVRAGIFESGSFVDTVFHGVMCDGTPIDGTRYTVASEWAKAHGYKPYDFETIARVKPEYFRHDKSGALKRTQAGKLQPITYDFMNYYKHFVLPQLVELVHTYYTTRDISDHNRAHVEVTPTFTTTGAIKAKKPRTTKRRGGKNNK